MSYDGKFEIAGQELFKKGLKAYFKICRNLDINFTSPSTFMNIFDKMVKPVLLYCAEVWALDLNLKQPDKLFSFHYSLSQKIESLNTKMCRFLLGVHSKSSLIATYGELGRYPLMADCIRHTLLYWNRINDLDSNLLLGTAMEIHNEINTNWINNIKWINRNYNFITSVNGNNTIGMKAQIKDKVLSIYKIKWKDELQQTQFNTNSAINNNGGKLRTYRIFKNELK